MSDAYRIIQSTAASLDIHPETVALWYSALAEAVCEALNSGHTVPIGGIGLLLSNREKVLFTAPTAGYAQGARDQAGWKSVLAAVSTRSGLSPDATEIIAHAFLSSIKSELGRGAGLDFEALGVWSVAVEDGRDSSDAGAEALGEKHPAPPAGDGLRDPSAGVPVLRPVDLGAIAEEVRRELGITFGPAPTSLEPETEHLEPAIDKETLGRIVRRHMVGAETPRLRRRRASASAIERPAPTEAQPVRTQTQALPEAVKEPGEAGPSSESETFERNREQLYNPPHAVSRKLLAAAVLFVTVFLLGLLLYIGWSSDLFDGWLPERFRHASPSLELALYDGLIGQRAHN